MLMVLADVLPDGRLIRTSWLSKWCSEEGLAVSRKVKISTSLYSSWNNGSEGGMGCINFLV